MKSNKLIFSKQAKISISKQLLVEDTLVLDTETTGLAVDAEIIELTILSKSGVVLFNQLIKPVNPIHDAAIAVHGITNEMVANAPSFSDFASEIAQILNGKNLVAHNAEYDKQRLEFEFSRLNAIDFPNVKSWACTMLMNIYKVKQKWPKLIELANSYGISFDGVAHRSLCDAEVCRNILIAMANEKQPNHCH